MRFSLNHVQPIFPHLKIFVDEFPAAVPSWLSSRACRIQQSLLHCLPLLRIIQGVLLLHCRRDYIHARQLRSVWDFATDHAPWVVPPENDHRTSRHTLVLVKERINVSSRHIQKGYFYRKYLRSFHSWSVEAIAECEVYVYGAAGCARWRAFAPFSRCFRGTYSG